MIYFVRSYCKNFIKIGTTENLKRRLAELQAANPLPLKLLGTMEGSFKTEAGLHEVFSKYRVEGTEWFRNIGDIKALQKLLTNSGQCNKHGLTSVRDIQKAIQHLRIRERANRQGSGKLKNTIRSITNTN